MSVTFSVRCLRCGVLAPEVGDCGHIGAPTLATKSKRNALRPFGLIYAACAAVGLLSEELEAMRAFLEAHHGHRVSLLSEGDLDESEGIDEDGSIEGKRASPHQRGRFVDAFHLIECPQCGESHRSGEWVRVRPFPERVLSPEDARTFLSGADQIDEHVSRAGPPFDFFDDLVAFVVRHKGHDLRIALEVGARAKGIGPGPATVAQVSPPRFRVDADDEGRLGAPRDESLWEALRGLRHMDVDVRRRSITRLLASPEPSLFGHVASMLKDPDAEVRSTAAALLGSLDDARRLAPIGRALLDHDPRVRESAIGALSRAGLDPTAAAAAALAPRPEAPDRYGLTGSVEQDLFSGNVKTRAAAIHALSSTADEVSLSWIAKALADPDASVRTAAVDTLGTLLARTLAAIPGLLAAFDDYSRHVVSAALRAASSPRGDALVGRIEELIGESRVYPHEYLAALEAIGTARAQRALARLLEHPVDAAAAAYALSKTTPVHVLPELAAALSHADGDIAVNAAGALASLPIDLVLETLTEAFHQRPNLRHPILGFLESQRVEALRPLFLEGLRDPDSRVRLRAAMWLARLGDDESRAALIGAARGGDGSASAGAFEFLLAAGEPGTEMGLEKAFADALDSDLMAGSFIYSGNKRLEAAARRHSFWQPKKYPKVKWGSGRPK